MERCLGILEVEHINSYDAKKLLLDSVLFKFFEKRKITEFSKNNLLKNITQGIALGVVLQSLTILVIYLKGGYTVVSINPVLFIMPALAMAFTSAIVEET